MRQVVANAQQRMGVRKMDGGGLLEIGFAFAA